MSPHAPCIQSLEVGDENEPGSSRMLYPRKGSSGKGGGGSSGKGSSGGSSGKGSSSSSGTEKSVPISGSTGGRSTAKAYGFGGGAATTIPSGQLFAGRISGGGTRDQVYGTRMYGSGYPGLPGGTVAGRGFPFIFWPVVWGPPVGYGGHYLHSGEYGRPDNTSRPGGALAEATFSSNSTNSTFFIVSDNSTVASLIDSVRTNCSALGLAANSSAAPAPFNATNTQPRPEQAVQYYRASSVTLLLEGYNDTSALSDDANSTAPVPIPAWVDTALLDCLNDTIGEAAPLVGSGARDQLYAPNLGGLVALIFVLWRLFNV